MGKSPRNAEYTKDYNRKMFIRLLRSGPMSRAEIARRLGLTRAATSLIAAELLEQGVVRETEYTETRAGRTPIPVALRRDAGYAVGVYLSRDGCTIGIVDITEHLIGQEHLCFTEGSGNKNAQELADSIEALVQKHNVEKEKLVGIGISAPGPLDGERGRILNPPRFSIWNNTDIGPILNKKLNVPVYLENNASCLARYNLGKPEACGSTDFLLLLVKSGVGSGVISRGKVLKGAEYITSELGHTSINYKGRKCPCGNIGCLEAYAAVENLLQGTEFSNWRELIDAYGESEEARRLLKEEADYLSAGIVNLANIVSIDTVLIAGDLLYGIERLIPLIEENVNSRCINRKTLPICVLPASSGYDASVKAAADVAFDRYLMV